MKDALSKYQQFLERRYPGRSTSKHYMSDLGLFRDYIGEIKLKEVTARKIDKFVQAQSEKGLKATTINRRLSAISSFFDYHISEAEEDKWQNPVNWKRHSIRGGKRLPRDINDTKIEQLFQAIDEKRDYAMFLLMLNAGLRVGEVVSLKVEDIQEIPDSMLTRLRVCGKGEKERIVWLTVETMFHVQEWLEERPEKESDELFLNQHGRPLSVSGVQYRLGQYSERVDFKVSCHQLRHTFARRLAEQKMPIDSLAKLLGHNGLQTTQRYIDGADPSLRADFTQAMASKQPTASATEKHFPVMADSQYQPTVRPDSHELLGKMVHLAAELPQWLQRELVEHTLRLMPRWTDHRLVPNTHKHFGTLCRVCRWLVTNRHWSQLEQLQRSDLAAYVTQRHTDGFKARGISTELTTFRIFWQDLLQQEAVTNTSLLLVKAPAAEDSLPRYLTNHEFYRLEQVIQQETSANSPIDILTRTWFYLFAHTGIRLSELLNLRLGDCDLTGQRLRIQAGKGDRDRVLPLTDYLVSLLSTYLAIRSTAETDHLLIYNGAVLKTDLVSRRLRSFGLQASIQKMSPHRLRHTLATQLVNQGMPIVSLQKFLGHRDINNTLIYARVHDETVKLQFASAMRSIETLSVADWPTQLEPIVHSSLHEENTSYP